MILFYHHLVCELMSNSKMLCLGHRPQSRTTQSVLSKFCYLSTICICILDTSIIKSEDPEKNCPRCGGAVFSAEAIPCKGRSFHRKCATCATCENQLTYNTIFNGEDKEIYCEHCYQRKFASAGYRGAGCSSWVDVESNNVLRHTYQAF